MLQLTNKHIKSSAFFRALCLLILTFSALSIHAQNITMTSGGNSSVCNGTFLDPGGTGDYSGGNNTVVHTICSSTPGEFPKVDFTTFDLYISSSFCSSNGDVLEIFDGPNVSSTLIGSYKDGQLQGSDVIGSSGCLTFRFTTIASHSSGFLCLGNTNNPGSSGWSATISCIDEIPNTGDNCFEALPFCSDQSYNFPNATSGNAPSGPNYGCLSTRPRAIWYYLKIGQAGSLELGLSQTNTSGGGIDVDFAMWGPFTDIPSGCSSIMSGNLSPLQCSYSSSATETIGIGATGGTGGGQTSPPAAQVGEYYIVVMTNFNGAAGSISLNQTGGDGETDCSIIDPCTITSITANPGTCDPVDNSFSVTGEITFVDAPSTGNLIVEDCNGNTATYPAPFNSPFNYTITGITSDNANCNVTAYFSDDAGCTETSADYQNPPSCVCIPPVLTVSDLDICAASNGDLSTVIDPSSDPANITYHNSQTDANNGVNSFGGSVSTSGSYWIRAEMLGNSTCFNVYEVVVDVIVMDYTAVTSDENCGNGDGEIILTPTSGDAPYTYSIDNGNTTQASGTFTGYSAGIYNVVITDANGCSVSRTEVLDNIVGLVIDQVNISQPSCNGACDGEVTVTTTGGTAPFTFQWTDNTGSAIGSNSATITGLCSGDYSVLVTDANNCTFSAPPILIDPPIVDATFELTDFCEGTSNAATNMVVPGGTFVFNPLVTDGASIDASTGEITDAVGGTTYTVEYTTPGACPNSSTEQVTVLAAPDFTLNSLNPTCGNNDGQIILEGLSANTSYTISYSENGNAVGPITTLSNTSGQITLFSLGEGDYTDFEVTNSDGCSTIISTIIQLEEPDAPIVSAPSDIAVCLGEGVTLTANNPDGATISWSSGVTDGVEFTPSTSGSTPFIVIAEEDGCISRDTVVVTVNPIPNSNFIGDNLTGCAPHTVTFTDSSNLNNAICTWDFGDGTTSNVCDSVAHTYTGTGVYDVTLIVESEFGCIDTTSKINYVEIQDGPIANFSADPTVTEYNDTDVEFTNGSTNATNYIWNFGDLSAQINDVNPSHIFPTGTPGVYTVTLYAINDIGCIDSTSLNITIINPVIKYEIPNVFTPNGDNNNDFFKLIDAKNILDFEIIILNRWGNLVFESNDFNFIWNGQKLNDGSECTDGTYFYKINMKNMDGEEIKEHGFVQLSRGE